MSNPPPSGDLEGQRNNNPQPRPRSPGTVPAPVSSTTNTATKAAMFKASEKLVIVLFLVTLLAGIAPWGAGSFLSTRTQCNPAYLTVSTAGLVAALGQLIGATTHSMLERMHPHMLPDIRAGLGSAMQAVLSALWGVALIWATSPSGRGEVMCGP
ncbi:MAG: hypothetical protein LQ341_006354 [Variospora aurantia]|nr:MAG: hypothetical protein LQ341_006354 [Variospora aurantia]